MAKVFETTCAGLVTFKALPNHINAQPNKMFEYMSAGLPVIASNFPAWKSIVEGHFVVYVLILMIPKLYQGLLNILFIIQKRLKKWEGGDNMLFKIIIIGSLNFKN